MKEDDIRHLQSIIEFQKRTLANVVSQKCTHLTCESVHITIVKMVLRGVKSRRCRRFVENISFKLIFSNRNLYLPPRPPVVAGLLS